MRRREGYLLTTLVTSFLLASASASVATPARADDRAAARPLFDEGRRLMKAGKTQEACAKFEAASHLTSTSGVRLNLAACWAKLGRTASAWGMYDEARAIADRTGDTAASELAQKGKAELEPKLSRLVITVAEANAVGLQVTRDSEPVFSGAWGVGVPVDPGEHEIVAREPGHKPWTTKITVAGEGTTTTSAVPALEAEKSEVAAVVPPPVHGTTAAVTPVVADEPGASSSRGKTQRTVGLVTGGVGIVALGVGAYFGIKTASDKSDYQKHVGADGQCLDIQCQTGSQNAYSEGNLATVFIVAGAAVVAGGAVVWLTAPKAHSSGVGARLAPMVTMKTAGLALEGSW